MDENDAIKLSLETPLTFANGIRDIPPGGTGFVTAEDIWKYARISAEEFVAEHRQIKKQATRTRIEYDPETNRVVVTKAISH
jgi:hypothetical protein